ncbi:ABC transporter permease [Paenibacillus wulumuqiensis]|uniref:ABC transporter permease n=1 Tax=Paenibacillus wulumuqiensis TaxID=1567107 RepID=UPI00061933FF|nr:ABC transporter permease subunit [Paenibacillus wulumuqiensis]
MTDFMQLIWNETLKIYLRVSTWILLIFLVVFSPLMLVLMNLGDFPFGAQQAIEQSFAMYFLVILFSLIIASDSVAGEFATGTIKLLLIRPWQRWKILASKFLSVALFTLVLTLLFLLVVTVMGYILFPSSSSSLFGEGESNLFLLVLYNYIRALMLAAFAFMLSALFRSTALAITLAILLYFAGNIITPLLQAFLQPKDYWFVKVFLPANLDLTQYMKDPNGMFGVTSLGWSLLVLAVYFVVFVLIAWWSFTKRDVRA